MLYSLVIYCNAVSIQISSCKSILRVGKALRDKQKSLHDATDAHRRQMRLWRDVEALLIAKLAAAGVSGVASSEQLQSSSKPTAPAASSSPSRGGKRGADRLVIE